MANLRTIRRRISGVKNTRQLTRAMKMVAAAKLRRAQERVEGGRTYNRVLGEMIINASQGEAHGLSPISGPGKACLVFTSDRGLCGSYNTNIIKAATQTRRQNPQTHFILFGKKVIDQFRKQHLQPLMSFPAFFTTFSWQNAAQAIDEILQRCRDEKIGELSVIYTRFVSAGVQKLDRRTIFPFTVTASATAKPASDMLIEPDRQRVLQELVRLYSRFTFFHIAAEAIASEQGARMTAMDSATRNAKDMIDSLTLEMNRARQASITKELLEIISGSEALEG